MTTTVRSVRVELEAAVAGYIRDMKLAGSETDRAFCGRSQRIALMDRRLDDLNKSASGLARTSAEARVQQTQLVAWHRRRRALVGPGWACDRQVLRAPEDHPRAGAGPRAGGAAARARVAAGPVGGAGWDRSGRRRHRRHRRRPSPASATPSTRWTSTSSSEPRRTCRQLRLEFAKLGPDGAHFVQVLRDLQPELRGLQLLARAGVLPGFEEFIDDAITRLPIVEQIVNRLSREVGRLSADAGEALAGDRVDPVLRVRPLQRGTDPRRLRPLGGQRGARAGQHPGGLRPADPRLHLGGLERMTDRFADWSTRPRGRRGVPGVPRGGPRGRPGGAGLPGRRRST